MFLSICQRYNMKANHNLTLPALLACKVFINMSKIQYESKSQPKSFTLLVARVFINMSKIQYESKSQHYPHNPIPR